MQVTTIEQTDEWTIQSYGNGIAYSFWHKPTGREAFLQGDDAAAWRDSYESMSAAACRADSVWFHKSWNTCLAELCAEYLPA